MSASGKRIEILLVEDNECDIELTRHFFQTAKVHNHLHVVPNGEEALDFIFHRGLYSDSSTPDIVLMDVNLPKKSGFDILRVIRSTPATSKMPVLLLSGADPTAHAHHIPDMGTFSFIAKPLTFFSFFMALQSLEEFWLGLVTLSNDELTDDHVPQKRTGKM
jgi:CheY-like chemotaxis protein